jgi:hypothetical protein
MASLFITGEILGASGLDGVRRDLSLASLVDAVALNPSATLDGFYCSWQVNLGSADSGDARAKAGKEDARSSQWRVVRGLVSGQTQTHQQAALSADNSPSAAVSMLDAVWATPVDVHLAWEPSTVTDSPHVLDSWPHLELTVRLLLSLAKQ